MSSVSNIDKETDNRQASKESLPDSEYSGDKPIDSLKKDKFNRWPFAERVARTLAERTDPNSVVIGIYGAWGDGKTSTLNLMELALKQQENVVIVKFNPWYFESEERLLRSFFDALAEALGKSLPTKTEELGRVLRKYGKLLSFASIGSINPVGAAEGLGEAFGPAALEELRSRLERILHDSKKRIVVFLDDIDRLDRNEIQALFKLVKLSASFDYVSYILAFDDTMVAAALAEKYGNNIEAGRAFLGKIVQVPLHLPPADEQELRKLTFLGIDVALKASGIELTQEQVEAFGRHFVDGLEPKLKTPRQSKLYVNAVTFAMPILKGEVNPVDQMLIEGIRVFYPKLYGVIRDNPDFFLKRRERHSNDEELQKRAIKTVDDALGGLEIDVDTVKKRLIEVLFPRFGNSGYPAEWDTHWQKQQRICSAEYFDRYFRYSVPSGDVSDIQVKELLETAITGSQNELEIEIAVLGGAGRMNKLVAKLRQREKAIVNPAACKLAIGIARKGMLIRPETGPFGFDISISQGAILIKNLIQQTALFSDRETLANVVIEQAENLTFAIQCFRWCRKSEKEPDDQRLVSEEAENELGKLLANRIKKSAEVNPPYTEFGDDAPTVFWFWKNYGSANELQDHLRSRFENNPADIDDFLRCFVGRAWGIESGLSHVADFDRRCYEAVINLIDPQLILDGLTKKYGDLIGQEFHSTSEGPTEKRIAEQFAFIHKHATEPPKPPPEAHAD